MPIHGRMTPWPTHFFLPPKFLFVSILTFLYLLPSATWALPIDSVVTVQPIQVCDDFGIACAPVGFFEAETDKIWSQAGIDIDFLGPTQFNESDFLVLDNITEVMDLFKVPGHGNHPDTSILNMWFVNDIAGAFGFGELGGNGMAIRRDVLFSTMGIGRLGTIAHEIGHNLGLTHESGLNDPFNLMTVFIDVQPMDISDIFPDGNMAEQLNVNQINTARSSRFVTPIVTQPIPEPSTMLLFGSGLAGLAAWRYRKSKKI